jgi:hypothetical protein
LLASAASGRSCGCGSKSQRRDALLLAHACRRAALPADARLHGNCAHGGGEESLHAERRPEDGRRCRSAG